MTIKKKPDQTIDFHTMKDAEVDQLVTFLNDGTDHPSTIKKAGGDTTEGFSARITGLNKDGNGKFFITARIEGTVPPYFKTSELLVSMNLPTDTLFFKAKLYLEAEANQEYIFEIQGKIFKIQRRENFRLPVADPEKMQAQFKIANEVQDLLYKLPILNLSTTGLALICNDEEFSKKFTAGMILKDVRFSFDKKEIHCSVAEVRHVTNILKKGAKAQYKIGILLIGVSRTDQSAISEYTLREVARYFGRS